MTTSPEDTIVAPATADGEAALAIVRVSGPAALDLTAAALDRPTEKIVPRRASLGSYKDGANQALDQLVYIFYPDKQSFTGEPMVEWMCHGNPLIVQKIVEDLIQRGCRLAEPGEFTRRAFLNGRMDLSQAEAVSDLIRARSDKALDAARRQLEGTVGNKINQLIAKILTTTAQLEAYIDFPEEDLPPEDQEGPRKNLRDIDEELQNLSATRHYRNLLTEGIRTVILGAPNAGKSSLLNALVGEDRAIVSNLPGTTRDYIVERILIGPYLLNIMDTAGIHTTESEIELIGIQHTMEQAKKADLCLLVLDHSAPNPTVPAELKSVLDQTPSIVIENKCDLARDSSFQNPLTQSPCIAVSALKGQGMDALRQQIQEQVEKGIAVPHPDAVLVSARHAQALDLARSHIESSLSLLSADEPAELAAQELHLAIDAMGQVIGKIDNESMLDELFRSFCIGK